MVVLGVKGAADPQGAVDRRLKTAALCYRRCQWYARNEFLLSWNRVYIVANDSD